MQWIRPGTAGISKNNEGFNPKTTLFNINIVIRDPVLARHSSSGAPGPLVVVVA
jgi:hypothetical protein